MVGEWSGELAFDWDWKTWLDLAVVLLTPFPPPTLPLSFFLFLSSSFDACDVQQLQPLTMDSIVLFWEAQSMY